MFLKLYITFVQLQPFVTFSGIEIKHILTRLDVFDDTASITVIAWSAASSICNITFLSILSRTKNAKYILQLHTHTHTHTVI